jgi:ribosome maturation factor RimP
VALTGRPFYWIFARVTADRAFHTGLEAKIADIVEPRLEDQGFELVRVQVMGKETPTVQIMADRADGTPFNVEDCEQISHLLSAVLDVEDPITTAWTLEVSSAGIDRPLTRVKDWVRHAGFDARVELNFPDKHGRKRYTGTIIDADAAEARIKIETGEIVSLNRADMRKAKLVLTDALIAFTTTEKITN